MQNISEDSIDLWRQVSSAVEYLAAVERPGFSVWDAVADAINCWIGGGRPDRRWTEADGLRASVEELLSRLPPSGVQGGALVSEALGAALTGWLEMVTTETNDSHPFEWRSRSGFPVMDDR